MRLIMGPFFIALSIFLHSVESAPMSGNPNEMKYPPSGSGLRENVRYATTRAIPPGVFYRRDGAYIRLDGNVAVSAFGNIIYGAVAHANTFPLFIASASSPTGYQGTIVEELGNGNFKYHSITEAQQANLGVYGPINEQDMSTGERVAKFFRDSYNALLSSQKPKREQ